jgi:diguanylate cyclase (GGDEF)-like protein
VVGRWLLGVVVLAAAVTAVTSSLVYALGLGVRPDPVAFGMAVVAVAAVQFSRIPTRVGLDVVMLVWAELGLVIALCLVPVAWVSVAYAAGAIIGHAHRFRIADRDMRIRVGYAMSNATTAAASATGVVAAVHAQIGGFDLDFAPVRVDLARPETFLPLVLAVVVYGLVISLLTTAWVGMDTPARLGEIFIRLVVGKGQLVVGTVVASFAVAVALAVDRRWLFALAPVLWALHRAYAFHLRAVAERASWVTLADVTTELHQADEQAVARVALRGAVELFCPDDVELILEQPVGRVRYVGAAAGLPPRRIAEPGSLNALTVSRSPGPGRPPSVVTRRLAVGGTDLGQIQLTFRRPGGLTGADQHAFATFADAVASALHDAVTTRHLRTMTARTAFEAVHDPLTALFNRSTLVALGNAHLSEAAPGPVVALILLDLDGFRQVNDTLGLAAGDNLLRTLGQRLSEHCASGEIVGRTGADEFAVLLTDPTARGQVAGDTGRGWTHPVDRARELRTLLARPVEIRDGRSIVVEASAGVAVEATGGNDMSELLRRAELAVHQAKREPSRIFRYDQMPGCDPTDRLTLLAEFRDALGATDQLILEIQPTVDLDTGAPISAEALVRWQHPRLGRLAPRDFMNVIEPTELSGHLTLHVLGLAAAVAADWAGRGLRVPISVNLCSRCIVDAALPDRITELLAVHGLPADLLILEITETVTLDAEIARPVMARLRAAGVKISVDDFGTGSASLQFLTRFAVDEVKIDRASVAQMVDSEEAAAIVRATTDLAHRLGLRVVAEGVETEEQRATLRAMGVAAGQGYLLQPPRPVDESTAVLLDLVRASTALATTVPDPRIGAAVVRQTAGADARSASSRAGSDGRSASSRAGDQAPA